MSYFGIPRFATGIVHGLTEGECHRFPENGEFLHRGPVKDSAFDCGSWTFVSVIGRGLSVPREDVIILSSSDPIA